jgi:hypothetical protein
MSHQGSVVHFSSVAEAYAAYRPTYPARLFDWLAADLAPTVFRVLGLQPRPEWTGSAIPLGAGAR